MPDVRAMLRWMVRGWFPVSERLIILLLAILVSFLFQPSLSETSSLSAGWLVELFLRKLLLMCLVAGGLHWYFYMARKQADDRRYDAI